MRIFYIGRVIALALSTPGKASPPSSIEQKAYIEKIDSKDRSEADDRVTSARLAHAISVINIDEDGMSDNMVDYERLSYFDFQGSNCGTFGAAACPASFAWDGKAGRMVERPHQPATQSLI